jgi:O-antigen ligase
MIHQRITDGILIALPLLVMVAAKSLSPLIAVIAVLYLGFSGRAVNKQIWHEVKKRRAVHVSLGLILAWPLLSALWSPDPAESLHSWVRVVSAILAGLWAVYAIPTLPSVNPRVVRLAGILVIAMALLLALETLTPLKLIHALSVLTQSDYTTYMRSTVNRGLCAMAVLVWPVVLGLHRLGYKWAWALPVMLVAVFSTLESLAAIVGLVVGMLVWLALNAMPKHMPRLLSIGLPVAFFVLPFLLYWVLHSSMMDVWGDTLARVSSNRIAIWGSLFEQGSDKPIMGLGMNTSHLMPMRPELITQLNLQGPPMHPHCTPLQVALELGIIGLAMVSVALYFFFRQLAQIPEKVSRHLAMVTATAFVVVGLVSFNVWQNWWIACGCFAALCWRRFTTTSVHQS